MTPAAAATANERLAELEELARLLKRASELLDDHLGGDGEGFPDSEFFSGLPFECALEAAAWEMLMSSAYTGFYDDLPQHADELLAVVALARPVLASEHERSE